MDALSERLRDWARTGPLPMHMPGHKRNVSLAPYLQALGAGWDVTEVPGLDDLHAPEEILKDAMDKTARLYGSEDAFFLVNGSSGGILAAIRAATQRGDRVLVARNCHKAVFHALEICGLRPVFLQPPQNEVFGCAVSLPPAMVEQALRAYPDTRLLILTSPTYEGVLSDVTAICAVAHRQGVPVFVDEAHGAHLGLGGGFPAGAVAGGADLVVQSMHKTLPSLTQTAVLHRAGDRISRDAVQRQLGIFQTSSPSYLLMASLCGCVDLLETQGTSLLKAWRRNVAEMGEQARTWRALRLLGPTDEGVFAFDPSKLVIGCAGTGCTGLALAERLRTKAHIELEMALEPYALAMTGMGDTQQSVQTLATALAALDRTLSRAKQEPLPAPPLPRLHCLPEEVRGLAKKTLPLQEAEGCVAADGVWAYPPGVPLVLPGEEISAALLEVLARMHTAGVKLVSGGGVPAGFVSIVCF